MPSFFFFLLAASLAARGQHVSCSPVPPDLRPDGLPGATALRAKRYSPQPGRLRLLAIMGSIVVAVLVVAILTSGNLRNALIVGDIVLVVSCLGLARSGIRCDAKGVALQGLTLTHRFTWAEVVKFKTASSTESGSFDCRTAGINW